MFICCYNVTMSDAGIDSLICLIEKYFELDLYL